MTTIQPPPNEGNLPLIETHDDNGNITGYRIDWQGHTIKEQFPWTRPLHPQQQPTETT